MRTLLLTWTFLVTAAFPQQLIVKMNGVTRQMPDGAGSVAVASVDNAPVPQPAREEELRVIVEMKAPSRLEQRLSGRLFSKTVADRARRSVREMVQDAEVHREFEEVMNGLVLTASRSQIGTIAAMPEVRGIYPDVTVSATPVDVRSAEQVVPQGIAGATGKGIRIGIIDTGVDYLHESFGGRMGSGMVVAGGYDLVNNDPDPMDDNGHGTHVAGIIAGRSASITGAANGGSLFVYKALDQNGSGSASTVLAAIERAIRDSVQVLNMSLGSPSGAADDPLSAAVNRAVRAGIVVVVAAGNTGAYAGINSPGIAPLALTVGASDGASIASFSSKGPETQTYAIKPDVVAPGVSVVSAKRGGGYVQMSGTSMAAPFVTALAALMKELHPEWSALEIRDAIVSNARSLGTPLFTQGHGRADAAVLQSVVFSSPSTLSFGFDPPAENIWKQQRTVTITNRSGAPKQYRLISGTSNPAIRFRFSPSDLVVPANGSAEAVVELEANNLLLGNNSSFEAGYTGSVMALGTDTVTIPFAFIKAPVLTVSFNELPWMVLIHNRSTFTKTLSPSVNGVSLIVKEGVYDIVTAFYGSRYVVQENVPVSGRSTIDIASTQATHAVAFQPVNERGEALALGTLKGTHSYLEAFVHKATGFALLGMGGGKTTAYSNKTKYFSSVSPNYAYGYSMTLQPNNAASYTYDLVLDSGITAQRSIQFRPEEIKSVEVKYELAAGVQRAFPITWTNFVGKYSSLAVTFYDGNAEPLRFPFNQKAFYTQRRSSFPIFHQREAYSY